MGKYTKGKKTLLSISVLVSNSIDTIRNCMESIRPLLEAVPSELIVVDGGSKDGAIDIAAEYADEVIPFVWCNDFSAARNAGLERTSGEWFLYLDDDEWFEDVSELIAFFQTGEYEKYDLAWYVQRNYRDQEGLHFSCSNVSRMCRQYPDNRFMYRIHECFSHSFTKVKYFSAYVHHYGYVGGASGIRKQKSERNLALVEQEYMEHPQSVRMAAQLVQEYIVAEQFEKAEELIYRVWGEQPQKQQSPFMQHMLVSLPHMETMKENWNGVFQIVERLNRDYPLDELAKLACMTEWIRAAWEQNEFAEILNRFPDYVKLYQFIQDQNAVYQPKLVLTFAQYVSPKIFHNMVLFGVECMLKTGDFSLAGQLMSYIDWKQESEKPVELLKVSLLAYAETEDETAFFPYCQDMLENPLLTECFSAEIEKLLESYPEKRWDFTKHLEGLHRKEPFFLMLHIEYCLRYETAETIQDAILQYFSVSKGRYDAEVAARLLVEPKYVNEAVRKIDFETFRLAVTYCLKGNLFRAALQNMSELEAVWNSSRAVFLKYFKMVVLEECALAAEQKVTECLWNYAEATIAFASACYAAPLLEEENWFMLPRNCQFAFWMRQAVVCKNMEDTLAWMERMKQAAEVYPAMIPAVQAALKEEKKKTAVSPELQQLAEELKKNIRELVKAGHKTEASELLQGLEQYVPQDEDLEELREMVSL